MDNHMLANLLAAPQAYWLVVVPVILLTLRIVAQSRFRCFRGRSVRIDGLPPPLLVWRVHRPAGVDLIALL